MNRADRNRIKDSVVKTLEYYDGPLTLPIPIKQIAKHYPNVRVVPYSTQMRRRGLSYQEMLSYTETDDACADYYAGRGYVIYYNDVDDKKVSSNRYRWNIAHELGHIALNHHIECKESRIFRNEISKSMYKKLEDEADMFAAYILVPHIVLQCLEMKEYFEIADICRISSAASIIRSENIKIWANRNKSTFYDFKILNLYAKFLSQQLLDVHVAKWLSSHSYCSACDAPFESEEYKYCKVCGSQKNIYYRMRQPNMIHSGVELNENMRACICPSCKNEEHVEGANYCMICGKTVVNQCSDSISYEGQCAHADPLPGNARYCPYCGSKTTSWGNGFLTAWDSTSEDFPF